MSMVSIGLIAVDYMIKLGHDECWWYCHRNERKTNLWRFMFIARRRSCKVSGIVSFQSPSLLDEYRSSRCLGMILFYWSLDVEAADT